MQYPEQIVIGDSGYVYYQCCYYETYNYQRDCKLSLRRGWL